MLTSTPRTTPHGARRARTGSRCGAVAVIVLLVAVSGAPQSRPLSGVEWIAGVYDRILDASFDEAAASIAACAAPAEACLVLEATRLGWAILLDPNDRSHDSRFLAAVDAAIRAAEAWTRREPRRAEAWFYLGGAYGARVQWRVLRGERLAAARDGKRIKTALERAVALDPTFDDAYFGIGLYRYYADVAPTVLRLLRWLLLLPGGDRAEGLQQMLRTRERGQVLRSEADYQLHVIYLWYERDFEKAMGLLRDLERRHPRNPHFPQLMAEVYDVYFHDATASRDAYARLLALAQRRAVNLPRLAEAQARLGLARQLDALSESDMALQQTEALLAMRPVAPYAGVAQAYLLAGEAQARLGREQDSKASFDAALAAVPSDDALDLRPRVRRVMRRRVDARGAEAYRLSLQGWRALEREAFDEAETALARAVALAPSDPVTRYRYAHVLASRGRDEAAAAEYARVTESAASSRAAPVHFALACVESAAIAEARGDRARAAALYRRAVPVFGAARATRDAARAALARLER